MSFLFSISKRTTYGFHKSIMNDFCYIETNCDGQRFVNTLNSDRRKKKELFIQENLPGYELVVSHKRKQNGESSQDDKRLKSDEIKDTQNESTRISLPRKSKSSISCAPEETFSEDEKEDE